MAIDNGDSVNDGCPAEGGRTPGLHWYDLGKERCETTWFLTLTPEHQVRTLKPDDPQDLLNTDTAASVQSFESPGLGQELRLCGEGITGVALVIDDRVVLLNAFRIKGEECAENEYDGGQITLLAQRRRNRSFRNRGQ